MSSAFPIGWTISHVLLFVVYFVILTPVGWLLRLSGKDLLDRRLDRDAVSYWTERTASRDASRYFRQF